MVVPSSPFSILPLGKPDNLERRRWPTQNESSNHPCWNPLEGSRGTPYSPSNFVAKLSLLLQHTQTKPPPAGWAMNSDTSALHRPLLAPYQNLPTWPAPLSKRSEAQLAQPPQAGAGKLCGENVFAVKLRDVQCGGSIVLRQNDPKNLDQCFWKRPEQLLPLGVFKINP